MKRAKHYKPSRRIAAVPSVTLSGTEVSLDALDLPLGKHRSVLSQPPSGTPVVWVDEIVDASAPRPSFIASARAWFNRLSFLRS